MGLRFVVRAFVPGALVSLALAASGCRAKGNGIGTAPPSTPCPTTVLEDQPCTLAEVCAAPCGGMNGPVDGATASYLYCPGGSGATWQCVASADGGVLENPDAADAADADADAAPDADADADAAKTDGETATDGADADADAKTSIDGADTEAPDVGPDADAAEVD